MLGCSQTWWSSQQWIKACLNNLEMFCSREKSTEAILNQQSEKSTQIQELTLYCNVMEILTNHVMEIMLWHNVM